MARVKIARSNGSYMLDGIRRRLAAEDVIPDDATDVRYDKAGDEDDHVDTDTYRAGRIAADFAESETTSEPSPLEESKKVAKK